MAPALATADPATVDPAKAPIADTAHANTSRLADIAHLLWGG